MGARRRWRSSRSVSAPCRTYERPREVAQFREGPYSVARQTTAITIFGLVPSRLFTGDRLPLGRINARPVEVPPPSASDVLRSGCGADLTGRQLGTHITIGLNRPATSEHVVRRARNSQAKPRLPTGAAHALRLALRRPLITQE